MKSEYFETARPQRVFMSNREFVESLDLGTMDEDRKNQINAAYKYIGGSEYTEKSGNVESNNYRNERMILIMGWALLACAIGIFGLDYFNIIDLGIFKF